VCAGINVYDCLRHKKVVLSLDAVRDIEDMLAPPRASAA
jgi:ribosomal protein L4